MEMNVYSQRARITLLQAKHGNECIQPRGDNNLITDKTWTRNNTVKMRVIVLKQNIGNECIQSRDDNK